MKNTTFVFILQCIERDLGNDLVCSVLTEHIQAPEDDGESEYTYWKRVEDWVQEQREKVGSIIARTKMNIILNEIVDKADKLKLEGEPPEEDFTQGKSGFGHEFKSFGDQLREQWFRDTPGMEG